MSNWDKMQVELDREEVDVEEVQHLVVKLTETVSKGRTDCQLDSGGVLHRS